MKLSVKKVSMALTTAGVLGVAGFLNTNQDTNKAQAATAGETASVSAKSAINVYAQPSANAQVVSHLDSGSSWKVGQVTQSEGKTWYLVGANQWVDASSMADGVAVAQAPAGTDAQIQKVISVAQQQIGKPYVWGAKGPNAFDCSGLMNYVFKQATGRDIGGWTVPQESAGTIVSPMQAKPGDLLFWGGRGATYHVALFIGNGQYIHAPQPGQNVTVANVSPYFWPSFAVRVL
ncbi:C40 family peptidase [Agrilactobacillus fermenti]|uniref:C40 family peptidase n=1 Tax=Agrilactobacillus fermenti TaxID=2586909 RepID=UPI002E7C1F69|nr:NlpC/P60 family protein [Agrilactobacillus fermenti]